MKKSLMQYIKCLNAKSQVEAAEETAEEEKVTVAASYDVVINRLSGIRRIVANHQLRDLL